MTTIDEQRELLQAVLDYFESANIFPGETQAVDELCTKIENFINQANEKFMNEQEVEQEIKDKGLDAPRITPERIDSVIAKEDYYVFPGTTLTVCCLTLRNGFNVTGESACVSLDNFNEELGRKIARQNAREKIWLLEGYALRDRLKSTQPNN